MMNIDNILEKIKFYLNRKNEKKRGINNYFIKFHASVEKRVKTRLKIHWDF